MERLISALSWMIQLPENTFVHTVPTVLLISMSLNVRTVFSSSVLIYLSPYKIDLYSIFLGHVRQIHEKHLLCTYQCPKCTYSTVRKDQMRSHFSVVHEDFKPFYCSECNFRAPKAFRVTVREHLLITLITMD